MNKLSARFQTIITHVCIQWDAYVHFMDMIDLRLESKIKKNSIYNWIFIQKNRNESRCTLASWKKMNSNSLDTFRIDFEVKNRNDHVYLVQKALEIYSIRICPLLCITFASMSIVSSYMLSCLQMKMSFNNRNFHRCHIYKYNSNSFESI